MALRILLLGSPELMNDGRQIDIPGVRPLALLAYLILNEKPQSREHLANLLFDGPDDPRASLRWTLSQLRKAISAEAIHADRQQISFNFAGDYWLDVNAFEAGAIDLYRGELLAGVNVRDAHQYEAWLLAQRERLRALYQTGLEERLWKQQEAEDGATAEETALRLLQLDNLREDWHRALMSAYAQQGKFAAAQAQYELCQTILHEELNAEPAPATIALAKALEEQQANMYTLLAARSSAFPAVSGSVSDFMDQESPLLRPSTVRIEGVENGNDDPQRWILPRIVLLIALVLLAVVLVIGSSMRDNSESAANVAAESGGEDTQLVDHEFNGTMVSITGTFSNPTKELLSNSLLSLEKETGIKIQVGTLGDEFEEVLPTLVASGLAPDIVSFPQPGFLAQFVQQGQIVDPQTFLDEVYLRNQYSDALLEAATIYGQLAGVWYLSHLKSMVWYPQKAFDAAGYEVPQTWDELLALSDQMVADGQTPWCIGIESGPASGWIGTDWVEEILLRTTPPETYDAWVAGELPFDSPEIRRAFAIMENIWLDDRYTGGTAAILSQGTIPEALFQDPPGCYLLYGSSYSLAFFPVDVISQRKYDFFYLPPIDSQYGRPVVGGGEIMAMFNDRPEVREVMRYLTTAASVRSFVERGAIISPHKDAPFEWYSSSGQLKMAQLLLVADTYRFDGSDMMPAEVGTGIFWQGIVDWVSGKDLDTVLQAIDESWPREE